MKKVTKKKVLPKAQPGINVRGKAKLDAQTRAAAAKIMDEASKVRYSTSDNWADNYSLDTTGLAKGSNNLFPYRRSTGTKGAVSRAEAMKIVQNVKTGKLKPANMQFEKKGGTIKKKK
jgi:hypothetical protein